MKKIATTLFFLAVCFPLMSQNTDQTYITDPVIEYSFPKARIAIDVGGTYLVGAALPGTEKLVNKLRMGFKAEGDVHGFVSRNFGLGAKVAGHFYSASIEHMGDVEITTLYVAPSFIFRWRGGKKPQDFWVLSTSIGYVDYTEKGSANGYGPKKFNKPTLGSSVDIGYDIRVINNTFWGFKFSFFMGSADFGNDGVSGFNAVELSTGLRF